MLRDLCQTRPYQGVGECGYEAVFNLFPWPKPILVQSQSFLQGWSGDTAVRDVADGDYGLAAHNALTLARSLYTGFILSYMAVSVHPTYQQMTWKVHASVPQLCAMMHDPAQFVTIHDRAPSDV